MAERRSNSEWLRALRMSGLERDNALEDLRALLRRGLTYALAGYRDVQEDHIEDFVQDALVRILGKLDTFRGESRFLTWAQKVAVRVAFSELRRHRWRDVPLEGIGQEQGLFQFPAEEAGPEQQAIQRAASQALQDAITRELTDKQRQAVLAIVVQGMPLEEVARRMDTNRNALYKLLHDARARLKRRLLKTGFSAEEIMAAFSPRE